MKLKKNILLLLSILLMLNSCKKDTYLPSVVITSMKTKNKITTISLNIEKNNKEINYTGICYDTISNPDLLTNQILKEGEVTTIEIYNLKENKEFYFKAFASNKYGYKKSDDFKYKVPFNDVPKVPCSLTKNLIIRNNIPYSINYTTTEPNYLGEYTLKVETSAIELFFTFDKKPSSNIYKTISSLDNCENSDGCVKLSINHSISSMMNILLIAKNNCLVYIENNNKDSIIVSFCDVKYFYNNVNYILKGNFAVKY